MNQKTDIEIFENLSKLYASDEARAKYHLREQPKYMRKWFIQYCHDANPNIFNKVVEDVVDINMTY